MNEQEFSVIDKDNDVMWSFTARDMKDAIDIVNKKVEKDGSFGRDISAIRDDSTGKEELMRF